MKALIIALLILLIISCSKSENNETTIEFPPPATDTSSPPLEESPPPSPTPTPISVSKFEYNEELGSCINNIKKIGYNEYQEQFEQCVKYKTIDLSETDLSQYKIDGSEINDSLFKNTNISFEQNFSLILKNNNINESSIDSVEKEVSLLFQQNAIFKNTKSNGYTKELLKVLELNSPDAQLTFSNQELEAKYSEITSNYLSKYQGDFRYDGKRDDKENQNIKNKLKDVLNERTKNIDSQIQEIKKNEEELTNFNKKIADYMSKALSSKTNKELLILQLNDTESDSEKDTILEDIKNNQRIIVESSHEVYNLIKYRKEIEYKIETLKSDYLERFAEIEALTNISNEYPERFN